MTGLRWWLLSPLVLALVLAENSKSGGAQDHFGTPNISQMYRSAAVEVVAAPSGSDAINVQWTLIDTTISDQVTSYVISWSGEGEGDDGSDDVDGSTTTYTIKSLVPCTTYTITVQPTADSAPLGDPGSTTAHTSLQVPTPVSSVTPTTVFDNSHQLNVSWTLFEDIGRCSGYYKVTWNGTQEGEAEVQDTTRYIITGLDIWTLYHVCVDSGTDQDSLYDRPKCKNGWTDEEIPGPPQSVRVLGTTAAESITVAWDPPAAPNGVITKYSVTWSPDDGTAVTTNTTYTLTGLLPCTTYTVTVSAATSKGYGPSEETSGATQSAVPGPPTNVTVNMVPNQSDTLAVNWTQPDTKCDITNNNVTWLLSSTGVLVDSVTVDPTDHYIISGLDPWTTYLVCVKAATLGGDGPDAPCLNQTTGEGIPGGPPENIMLVTTTSDSIKLKWDPPAAPNGVIINYSVTWSPDDGTADTTDTTYTLAGLLPCTTYTVTVSAATSKGYGPPGNTSDTTQPGVPGPPTNVTVNMVPNQSNTLAVSWIQPDTMCDIINNTVTWLLNSSTGALVDNVTVDPTDHYTISGLDPWTTYLVCVSATTLGGDGAYSPCVNQTTEEDVPESPPENIMVVSTTVESMTVDWDPPIIPNGVITSYSVTWSPDDSTVDIPGPTYTVTGLLPCTTYTVTVSAATSKGNGPSDNTSDTTQPTAPPPVTDLNVTQMEREPELGVTWSTVTPPGDECNVAYRVSWSYMDNTEVGEYNTTDAQYTITDLSLGMEYIVCVESYVEEKNASRVCDQEATISSSLGMSLEPSPSTILVSWFLIDNVDTYLITWSSGNDGAFASVHGEINHYIIDDVRSCTNYSVKVEAKKGSSVIDNDSGYTRTPPTDSGPVSDLNVTQVIAEPALGVTWSAVTQLGNCGLYYRVTWSYTNSTEVGSNTTTEIQYTIMDLTYETEYVVCVDPWVDGQNGSLQCETEAVIESRLNMYFVPSPTTIEVHWYLVSLADSYFIVWAGSDGGSWATVDGSTDQYIITSLQPCSNYSIRLEAKSGGDNLKTENKLTNTLPQAPSPVTNLDVTQVDREPALEVSWSPVLPPGNCYLTYRVTWIFTNGTEAGSNITSEPHYTISDLSYGTKYTVCVDSWAEGQNASQVCDQETTITSKLALHLEAGPSTIEVYWTKIDGADIYHIKWSNGEEGAWTSVDGALDTYIITDVQPSSNYTVNMEAKNENEILETDVDSIVTLAQGRQAPRGLRVVDQTTGTVRVVWKPPPAGDHSRVLLYSLTWDEDNKTKLLPSNIHDYTIGKLSPGITYIISLEAETSDGWGPATTIQATTEVVMGAPKRPASEETLHSGHQLSTRKRFLPLAMALAHTRLPQRLSVNHSIQVSP